MASSDKEIRKLQQEIAAVFSLQVPYDETWLING